VLVQFLGAVNDLLRKFIREVSSLPRATQNALAFHRDILKSIRERDAGAAENSILNHLNDVVKNIAKNTGMELWTTFDLMAGKRDVPADSEAPGSTRGK
jgi:DNA-binding FadR family transcriptional regulator